MIGDINIRAYTLDGLEDQFDGDTARVMEVMSSTDVPLREVDFSGDSACIAPDVQVVFVDTCVPEFPVYLRWVNRLGGYEYHMFHGRKTYKESVKRGDEYTLYNADELSSRGATACLRGEVTRTIDCGSEGLSFDLWRFLKGVALSPCVELFDSEREAFVRVVIDNTDMQWNTANATGSVELTVILPDEAYRV